LIWKRWHVKKFNAAAVVSVPILTFAIVYVTYTIANVGYYY